MYLPGEEHLHNATLRENVFMRRHESGVPVYFCSKSGFQKRYACFATHFGSIDNSFQRAGDPRIDVPDGLAHFLEHKLFEGEDRNAFDKFSQNGASSNAYTSFEVTNYLFSCSRDFFANLRILIDFVQSPYFTDENVEKEKGIIGQEIRMYEDSPGWRAFFNLLEALYSAHPIRKDIAGSVESISHITKKMLYDCYHIFYHPENMILFGIGDEAPEEFFECVDSSLTVPTKALGSIQRFFPDEPKQVAETRREQVMEISMPRLLMGFKDQDLGYRGRELLAKDLTSDILLEILFGRASEFFQKWYSENLIDESFSASYTGTVTVGHSMLGGETPNPEKVATVVLEELERAQHSGISAADFQRQKRATMGRFFQEFNSLEFIANHFCAYKFVGIELFDLIDVLNGIQQQDLERRLREHLTPDAVAVSVLQPKSPAGSPGGMSHGGVSAGGVS
ncbi:MAG: pitrilysin family protein [Planctomycetota bacterium]